MCTREEVRDEIGFALVKNNKIRDLLWEERNKLLLDKIEVSIDNKFNHLSITSDTKDEFNNIQRVCDVRGVQLKTMDDKIDKLTTRLDEFMKKIDKRDDETEKKIKLSTLENKKLFANKWVEKIFIWIGTVIGLTLLTGILALLAKLYLHLG
jgi:tetrahydromethanopterin S-methyltransferase subunit G